MTKETELMKLRAAILETETDLDDPRITPIALHELTNIHYTALKRYFELTTKKQDVVDAMFSEPNVGPNPYGVEPGTTAWVFKPPPPPIPNRISLEQSDAVVHPSHYNQGKIEVIDVIDDWKLGFHEGNVVKYVARAKHKGYELQDLKKARWYLERAIQKLETT